MYDVGIEHGKVYVDGTFHDMNVYIKGETIRALTTGICECSKRINAQGKFVLPGFIDPHVHFSLGVGANMSKDDFYSGSVEAAYGGVTTYIDFLDPIKKTEEIKREFESRLSLASKSVVDYAFHATVANPTSDSLELIKECKKYGIDSIKLFTTYADTDRRTYDDTIYELLKASKEENAKIVIHAENDDLINHGKDILVKDHERARATICENVEVLKLAQLARKSGGNLYIVHVSAGSSVKLLSEIFKEELESHQITLESCPHYFLLNSSLLEKEDGYKYTMTPPIRPEEERVLLNQYKQYISTIGTDHCPYTKEQKAHTYTSEVPMGIGGIRYSFLNMYSLYGFQCLNLFTKGPAEAYHLEKKGVLLPGYDADLVIFDPSKTTVVDDEMSVYDKKELQGSIESVLVRGSLVLYKQQLIEHNGRYIRRGDQNARH